MPDNVIANPGAGGVTLATDEIAGVHYGRLKVAWGADGFANDASAANPLPVDATGTVSLSPATLAALENITVDAAPGLTDTQLRASAVVVNQAAFGAAADASATDDTSAFSLIALTKRLLGKVATLGQKTMTGSMPVTIASDQAAFPVGTTNLSVASFTTAAIVPINTDILVIDCNGLRGLSIQCIAMGTTGVVTAAWSDDNVNFPGASTLMTPLGVNAATITAAGLWTTRVYGRFLRLRMTTATTAGATTFEVRGSALPIGQAVVQPVAGTVTANVAGAGITGGTISPLTVAGVSVEASSAKTITGQSAAAITNASGNAAIFFINVSAVTGTAPTLVVRVQVQDPVSLGWADLPGAITGTITAVGLTALVVAPGVVEVANSKASVPLPRTYRLAWTIGGTTPSFTFSVGAQYII